MRVGVEGCWTDCWRVLGAQGKPGPVLLSCVPALLVSFKSKSCVLVKVSIAI